MFVIVEFTSGEIAGVLWTGGGAGVGAAGAGVAAAGAAAG
jgi:hypothetical protein